MFLIVSVWGAGGCGVSCVVGAEEEEAEDACGSSSRWNGGGGGGLEEGRRRVRPCACCEEDEEGDAETAGVGGGSRLFVFEGPPIAAGGLLEKDACAGALEDDAFALFLCAFGATWMDPPFREGVRSFARVFLDEGAGEDFSYSRCSVTFSVETL